MTNPIIARVIAAIKAAECPHREGPFGGYDYGYNGTEPDRVVEGGRYVVRDFRDPNSEAWGKWVHQTDDRETHERVYRQMTDQHVAMFAINALRELTPEVLEAVKPYPKHLEAGRSDADHRAMKAATALDQASAQQLWSDIIDAILSEAGSEK